jgi:hypothetical protein
MKWSLIHCVMRLRCSGWRIRSELTSSGLKWPDNCHQVGRWTALMFEDKVMAIDQDREAARSSCGRALPARRATRARNLCGSGLVHLHS